MRCCGFLICLCFWVSVLDVSLLVVGSVVLCLAFDGLVLLYSWILMTSVDIFVCFVVWVGVGFVCWLYCLLLVTLFGVIVIFRSSFVLGMLCLWVKLYTRYHLHHCGNV